jgi:chromosome segregation ATPase
MKTIKKYWALILGAIIAFIGIFTAIASKRRSKKVDAIDVAIDNNDAKIDNIEGKIEVIEDQREEIKTDIAEQQTKIDELQNAKETIVEEPKDVADAKDNILNKTKRGRKKKK